MRQIGNAFLVFVTILLAFGLIFIDEADGLEEASLFKEEAVFSAPQNEPLSLFDYIYEFSEPEAPPAQSADATESQSRPSGSVEVNGGAEQALGKIKEQFLSPYTAKYSYNNVYMKNTSGISIDLEKELYEKLKAYIFVFYILHHLHGKSKGILNNILYKY